MLNKPTVLLKKNSLYKQVCVCNHTLLVPSNLEITPVVNWPGRPALPSHGYRLGGTDCSIKVVTLLLFNENFSVSLILFQVDQ